MRTIESASVAFVMDRCPEGGVDLFRKCPAGFVLVDTFGTPAEAHAFVEECRKGAAEPADGTQAAAA